MAANQESNIRCWLFCKLNSSGQGPVVGYANYKDTADINRYLSMPEVQAELPKDLRLKWGVSPSEFDPERSDFRTVCHQVYRT